MSIIGIVFICISLLCLAVPKIRQVSFLRIIFLLLLAAGLVLLVISIVTFFNMKNLDAALPLLPANLS